MVRADQAQFTIPKNTVSDEFNYFSDTLNCNTMYAHLPTKTGFGCLSSYEW